MIPFFTNEGGGAVTHNTAVMKGNYLGHEEL